MSGPPKKIIMADDDQIWRSIFTMLVKNVSNQEGIEVHLDVFEDGKQLIEHALATPYDLVFTDGDMLRTHGFTVIKTLREHNPRTPIYMLCASQLQEQALSLGATDYIDKGMNRLNEKIEAVIRQYIK